LSGFSFRRLQSCSFYKTPFQRLTVFRGYWFWAIARFVVFLLRPDKICDSGLFPFTVTLPESHSLLTCSNQRSIVTETLYRCYIVLQLNYLRIDIFQLIFGFSVLLLFCIAFVMLQVFGLSAFGLLCISFSNFYRLLFTAFHKLLFPWACISGFYNFIWVDLLSLLPCPIASVVVFCWILIIRNVGLYFPFFPIFDLVCFSVVRTSYCY